MSMLTEYEQSIVNNVARYGWQCTSVFDPDGGLPSFSYSIGLWETLCAPELIVFGLDTRLMQEMLWRMYDQLKEGAQLADHARWSGLIEGFDCISRPVHQSQVKTDYFNSALWYRKQRTGDSAISAFQIFWPGAVDGLFPWEKGAADIVRDLQPTLYLPDEPGNA
jgi:hypothetical protein